MIHRIALLVGGITAAVVLAFSVMRGDRTAVDAAAPDPTTQATTDGDITPAVREVVDTVYVAPPKRPKVVHVTRHVPSQRSIAGTTRQMPRSGGEREHGGNERGEAGRGDD
jgi:hypothetical protein